MEKNVERAGNLVRKNNGAYCKFLSANDSGENGSHQAGILISNKAMDLFITEDEKNSLPIVKKTITIIWPDQTRTESTYTYYWSGILISNKAMDLFITEDEKNSLPIVKKTITIIWPDQTRTESTYTYYWSKGEARITGFGKGFKYRTPEMTGSLFIITRNQDDTYEAFFLNNADDIDEFLSEFSVSATQNDLLRLLDLNTLSVTEDARLRKAIERFISSLDIDFPSTEIMARAAREIENEVKDHIRDIARNPDKKILSWTNVEYELFRALEQVRYQGFLQHGFKDIDEFVETAKAVLNRRKSRAGKSLEHHLAEVFDYNGIVYEAQVVTEGNKKPDFIFPSGQAYHDKDYPVEGLISLASKTTCKDRWRQVINEADRLKDRTKYLFTLQQGISENQLKEMQAENVVLVVPKEYITTYPKEAQKSILSLAQFIAIVKKMESEYGCTFS